LTHLVVVIVVLLLFVVLGKTLLALETLNSDGHLQLLDGAVVLHLISNLHKLLLLLRLGNRENLAEVLSGVLGLLDAGVTLLDLAALAREDDETGLVLLEALSVKLKGLDALVAAAGVNSNTDGESLLAADASLLKLSKSEATASAKLHVVTLGRAVNGRSQQVDRARGNLLSLSLAGKTTAELLRRLVEVHAHAGLPATASTLYIIKSQSIKRC